MQHNIYAETSAVPFGFNLVAACEQVLTQLTEQAGGELSAIEVSTNDAGGRELMINAIGSGSLSQRQAEEVVTEVQSFWIEDAYSRVLLDLELVEVS